MDHDPGVWLVVRLDHKFQSSLEPKYPRVDNVEGGWSMPCKVGIARQGFLWFVLHCILFVAISIPDNLTILLLQANSTFV